MNELTKRVLVAVPAAAIFLWMVWLGGYYFEILMGIVAIITLWEVHRIMTSAGIPDYFLLSLIMGTGTWFLIFLPDFIVFACVSILILITIGSIFSSGSEISKRWLSTLFSGIYAPVGYMMLVNIRNLGTNIEGFWLLVSFLLMIWGNDIFAYFGGKRFGKHPLAPTVSPKKTWEGFWFGFLGAATGLAIVFLLANPFPISFTMTLPLIVLVSVFGPTGDLLESRLKRIAGMKDSSQILPGHGGLFDRFDALILTSPFVFFYFFFVI